MLEEVSNLDNLHNASFSPRTHSESHTARPNPRLTLATNTPAPHRHKSNRLTFDGIIEHLPKMLWVLSPSVVKSQDRTFELSQPPGINRW